MAGEVVVAAARADRADLRVAVQRGLVDGAGVVIQAARDREVQRVVAFPARPARCTSSSTSRSSATAFVERRRCPAPSASSLRQRIGVAGRAHLRRTPGCVSTASADRPKPSPVSVVAHVRRRRACRACRPRAAPAPAARRRRCPAPSKKPRISLRLLSWMVNSPIAQLAEHRVDHRRDLGVVARRQRVLADHVDVALVELAEAAALRALAAVDALDLVAAEREGQVVLVLGHVARQRHGQVEAQRQLRQAFACPSPARRWTARSTPGARSRRRTWSAAPRTARSPAFPPAGSRSARSCGGSCPACAGRRSGRAAAAP